MNKAKEKVAAKIGKAKEKIAKKCGKAAKCALMAFAFASLVGCGSNPAAYSVTQNNQFDACQFVFGGASTNAAPVEMFTLAQNLENAGSQTADQTVKTDVSPEVAVGVGGSSAGVGQGGGSASGAFSKIGAAVDAVSSLIPSGKTEASPSTSGECADGKYSDGEECEDCTL